MMALKEEDLPAFGERCSLVHLSAREILIVTTCARLEKNSMGATGLVVRIPTSYLSLVYHQSEGSA